MHQFLLPEKFSDYSIALPTFLPIAPGPVSELSYEENTDTSVTITWKPPEEPNGDLVAYFVEHAVYQSDSTRSVGIDARRQMRTSTVIRALGKFLLFHVYSTQFYEQVHVPGITSHRRPRPTLDWLHFTTRFSHVS